MHLGLTKQCVLHHFPSRAALDAAVTRRALPRVGAAMAAAAAGGSPLETYLRLSAPTGDDQVVVLVLLAALRRRDGGELAGGRADRRRLAGHDCRRADEPASG